MAKQRKLKRIQLIASLEVFAVEDGRLLGVLMDITVEGMGVWLREALPQNAVVGLRLALPAEILGVRQLEVAGRCAWLAPASNPDLMKAGFEFVDIMPDAVEVIEELIRRYQR